jgi:hypothetical protein
MLCLREGGSWSQLLGALLDSVAGGETACAVSVSFGLKWATTATPE